MADELLKHLYDIREATAAIFRFIRGKTFDDYEQDELLRSGGQMPLHCCRVFPDQIVVKPFIVAKVEPKLQETSFHVPVNFGRE